MFFWRNFLGFLALLPVVFLATTHDKEHRDWDLAVVTNQIELLLANGSRIGTIFDNFSQLRGLTFDNVRRRFIVSNMLKNNDTIFTVPLTKETEITAIIEDLPDDVQGLAVDPISDILYWTDLGSRAINFVHLNDSEMTTETLFTFDDQMPQDLAIDVCRRYIYWTNSNPERPTIERAKLEDPSNSREVLVDTHLHRPTGIAIDYKSQRLFWADKKEGMWYAIESTNLVGKEREEVFRGTHNEPFGVAVDFESVYWTDKTGKSLWMIPKYEANSTARKIRSFKNTPQGIITKNNQISGMPDCRRLSEVMKNNNYNQEMSAIDYYGEEKQQQEMGGLCLNGGASQEDGGCECPPDFTGDRCDTPIQCHNYCVQGGCHLSSLGTPQCTCPPGLTGKRCEIDKCKNLCLNNGFCSHSPKLSCTCPSGFSGPRCEKSDHQADFCEDVCSRKDDDFVVSKPNGAIICACFQGAPFAENSTSAMLRAGRFSSGSSDLQQHLEDPVFLGLLGAFCVVLILMTALAVRVCVRRKRPRIKKRFIVNKNVTPLTYRPAQPATEQCEITIENCCNMNICETPCFEPPKLACMQAAKNEDKKKLLSDMENGEDFY